MNEMDFKEELKEKTKLADQIILDWLPSISGYPGSMAEAMRYSVLAGGKRIRPVLLDFAYRAYGGTGSDAEPFMAAMEFIHTSSLIHDDLPPIDNDGLRRGRPTVHVVFGEAMGVLAGDALLNYAYEVLMSGVLTAENTKNAARAAAIIANKSGLYGMLGGQGLDVEAEKGRVSVKNTDMLDYTYKMKTSALIEASLMAGAALAGASDEELALLERTGEKIGLAFQITDDILDETGTEEELGKPVLSDEKNKKKTYITLMGIDGAQKRADEWTKGALRDARRLHCESGFLKDLILYLQNRKA